MTASNVLLDIFNFVIWILVPLILLVILFLMRLLTSKAEDLKQKGAMRSGFWAGIILFVMALVYEVGPYLQTGFPHNALFQGFNLWLGIGAGLITFFLFLGGKYIIEPSMVGIFTLFVTFLASYALFHYLFIRTYNELVLSLTLGVAFGILTHFANPHSHVHKVIHRAIDSSHH